MVLNQSGRGEPWNKGKLVGQKAPRRLKEIWPIRIRIHPAERTRELALFNLAIDSKLRSCDLHGNFRLSDQASGIIKAWFGGVIALIICAAGMGIRTAYSEWWQVPLGGIGVLLAGFLFLLLAKYFYRGDEDWIAQQLRSLLGPGDPSQRLNVAPTAVTRE
jgi:hypothetical protein